MRLCNYPTAIMLLGMFLLYSCGQKGQSDEQETPISSSAKEGSGIETLFDLIANGKNVPKDLRSQYFSDVLKGELSKQANVTIKGESHRKDGNLDVIVFKAESGSKCLTLYVAAFLSGKMVAHQPAPSCDNTIVINDNRTFDVISSTKEKLKDEEIIIAEKTTQYLDRYEIVDDGGFMFDAPDTIIAINILKERAIDNYVCYDGDAKKLRIWVGFGKNGNANKVKYKGMKESIDLVLFKESDDQNKGGPYPVYTDSYYEVLDGKVNGVYELTKSANWYYVHYTRGKDGKVFGFTIDHEADPFGKKPCF